MRRILRTLLDGLPLPGSGPVNFLHNACPMRASGMSLTPRQRDVLELLWCGMSDSDIARNLGISEHTARIHVALVLPQLKVRHRAEATSVAISWDAR